MNLESGAKILPGKVLSPDDMSTIRDALLLGLDACGELIRLSLDGTPMLNPDPSGTAVSQFAAALRLVC